MRLKGVVLFGGGVGRGIGQVVRRLGWSVAWKSFGRAESTATRAAVMLHLKRRSTRWVWWLAMTLAWRWLVKWLRGQAGNDC